MPENQQKNPKNQQTDQRTRLIQSRQDRVSTLFALIGFVSYAQPYLFKSTIHFFELCFAIGMCYALGGTILLGSYRLKNIYDNIKASIAIFFLMMGTTLLINSISDPLINTNNLVLILLSITVLCFILLLVRKALFRS